MSEARARVCGASVWRECVRAYVCVLSSCFMRGFSLARCVCVCVCVCVCMIYFVLFAALTRAVHTYVFSFVLFAALARAVVCVIPFFLCVCERVYVFVLYLFIKILFTMIYCDKVIIYVITFTFNYNNNLIISM